MVRKNGDTLQNGKYIIQELGYITFYYSVLGFLSATSPMAYAMVYAMAYAIAYAIAYAMAYDIDYVIAIASAIVRAFVRVFDGASIFPRRFIFAFIFAFAVAIGSAITSVFVSPFASASAIAYDIASDSDYYIASAYTIHSAYCVYLMVMLGIKFGWNGVGGGIVIWILSILYILAYTSAKKKLNKQSVSKWKQFFIYAGTSSLGVFLGWLVYQFFPIFAHR